MEALFQKYFLDPLATSEIAYNRKGEIFSVGEEVKMIDSPVLYESILNHILIIHAIYKNIHGCESGYMVYVSHKETENKFKCLLDANWFKKISNGNK